VRIGVLGSLAVHDEAGRPVEVGGQLVRKLLIMLALDAGRIVPAYSLIERLWDDDPPVNAANSLQSLISRLRASLRRGGLGDQVIESHPAGYRLAVPPQRVDAVAFENLAREGSQALAAGDAVTAKRALGQALGAWRGPPLADAAAAPFAAAPAARLTELRTRAELDLIEAGLALGESDSLTGELRAMIAADPVAERPRGLLMRALYAAGRQAEALAVYGEARQVLADRLGVDPSPRLEQIYLAVLQRSLADESPGPPAGLAAPPLAGVCSLTAERRQGDSRPAPRTAVLRRQLTSFVGRDEDVARVAKMLSERRLVTLTGPGGAGKTRLAIETAARLAGDHPPAAAGGEPGAPRRDCQVWLVELAPVSDPDEVPYAVLHALGIRDRPVMGRASAGAGGSSAAPVERLAEALAQRCDLLILDNCEHVVAAAAALADQILARCPDVRILATSREPLRIAGEVLWPVQPLPVPPAPADPPGPQEWDEPASPAAAVGGTPGGGWPPAAGPPPSAGGAGGLAGYASVQLLADRAAAVRPDFTVDAANAADVAWICRALDGMPLAIELAAARLRTLSAAQLAQRLDARFVLLTGGSRTAVPRHQTLRAVVEWSWELLSEPEQVLARRLAAFPGGATLAAAEQVCQCGALPAGAVLPAIFGLVEKSFLTVDSDDEPRYRMLETIRAYCAERLAEAGEAARVRDALASYFVRLAETADPLLRTGEQVAWMRRLAAEQDNIHAALRWAVDRRDVVLALRFGQALGWFWLLRSQRRESAEMAAQILAISDPAEHPELAGAGLDVAQARAVCALITVNASWDIAAAKEPLAAAGRLLAAPGGGAGCDDRPPHPLVVAGAAMVLLYEDHDPDRALRVLAGGFESPDPWTRAGTRLMHALYAMNLGTIAGAAEGCAEALAGFREIGDRWGMALALMGGSELASLAGDHASAIAALEEAAGLSRELTDWEDTAQLYASLARSRSRMGDLAGARADMARAQRIARSQGEPESDVWVSFIRAELAWLEGDMAEVVSVCRRLDTWMMSKPGAMSWPFRAQIMARGGLARLRAGHGAGWAELAGALSLAAESQDRSAVAAVIDALAAAALLAGGRDEGARRAAVLLGAAHAVRGAFDHSNLDAPAARDRARGVLGPGEFETCYRQGQGLRYDRALALAAQSASG
jgi:predicted ATPase/DNA-binding SARP family transcriptional activator